jgi:hypothetical protein
MALGRKTGGRDFRPGQSGNPGGRPKNLPTELREAARGMTPKVLETLDKALDDKNPWIRIRACEILIERGWGKTPDAPRPGDDAMLIAAEDEAGLRPRVTFANVPVPSTADEWASKHSTPAAPPDPALIEQPGAALPPAKVAANVEGNGLAPWKPAERWPRVGER